MWQNTGLYYCVGQTEESLMVDDMSEDIEKEIDNRHVSNSPDTA